MDISLTKSCTGCGGPAYEKGGKCLACRKAAYKAKNLDKSALLQYWDVHGKKSQHPLYRAIQSARHRAKVRGLECTIILEDLSVPDVCPVFGVPFDDGEYAPSLDRFDNTKGYTKENVRVISARANAIKRDATREEVEKVLLYMTQCT